MVDSIRGPVAAPACSPFERLAARREEIVQKNSIATSCLTKHRWSPLAVELDLSEIGSEESEKRL